jgi:hypothetical protein
MDAINKLTPEQRQQVMAQAQQEANGQIMREMVNKMVESCFQKCAGTSVRLRNRTIEHDNMGRRYTGATLNSHVFRFHTG